MASQTQLPLEHLWPDGQAVLAPVDPHLQVPPLHVSEVFESHARQDEPAVPHEAKADVVQVWPAQHPAGQEVASQTHCPPRHR